MNENTPIPLAPESQDNEIIIYQPDSTVKLEVRLENETVWLTQAQMTELFQTTRNNITMHIRNVFKEGELDQRTVCKESLHTASDGKKYKTKYYNLDVIISVGYRVKSLRGTQFRQWANKVLKDYLLKGYSINQRLMHMESRIDHRLSEHDSQIIELSNRMDFFVRTSLPPREGIFFDGQIFDAYALMCDLVRSARKRIIMVDNYIDDSVLRQLDKRAPGVTATIYTPSVSRAMQQDLDRHNAQYAPIQIKTYRKAHDRFLIIDDTVYHVGASFKDQDPVSKNFHVSGAVLGEGFPRVDEGAMRALRLRRLAESTAKNRTFLGLASLGSFCPLAQSHSSLCSLACRPKIAPRMRPLRYENFLRRGLRARNCSPSQKWKPCRPMNCLTV